MPNHHQLLLHCYFARQCLTTFLHFSLNKFSAFHKKNFIIICFRVYDENVGLQIKVIFLDLVQREAIPQSSFLFSIHFFFQIYEATYVALKRPLFRYHSRISMETAAMGGMAGFQYIAPNHIIKTQLH